MSELIGLLWRQAKKAPDVAYDNAVFKVEDLLRASRNAHQALLECGKDARGRGDRTGVARIEKRTKQLTAALLPFGVRP